MRVLHVVPSLSAHWGGPAHVVCSLATALADCGVQPEVLTTRGKKTGQTLVSIPQAKVHCFANDWLACVWTAYSRELRRFVVDEIKRFDLIHLHEIWHYPGYIALRTAHQLGIPCVVSVHGSCHPQDMQCKPIRKQVYLNRILRPLIDRSVLFHALTEQEKCYIRHVFGQQVSMFTLPNGVLSHPAKDQTGLAMFFSRYPQLADQDVVLCIARLNVRKGLYVLAQSFSIILKRFPKAMLLIVGPDDENTKAQLERFFIQHNMQNRVILTGLLTGQDKRAALDCADLFVLPSFGEGFSIAVLEAMAASLPVVISDQCHFPQVVRQEVGFVTTAGEAEPLTKAISTLLADACLRKRMGENARKMVESDYTWPLIAQSLYHQYQRLIEGK